MLQTQRAMQRLRHISAKAAEAMLALERRSVQVEDIVRTIEENAAAANQMQATTHEITATMLPVARAAEEQSAAAQQAAFATGELASGVGEIDATARALHVPNFGSPVAMRG